MYDKDGPLLTVEKALYGIPVSANQWQSMLSATICNMGFHPCNFDRGTRMKKVGNSHYEYIGTHTDGIMVVSKDSGKIMDQLSAGYKMPKIKEPHFHLVMDYCRNDNGMWSIGTKMYVKH